MKQIIVIISNYRRIYEQLERIEPTCFNIYYIPVYDKCTSNVRIYNHTHLAPFLQIHIKLQVSQFNRIGQLEHFPNCIDQVWS